MTSGAKRATVNGGRRSDVWCLHFVGDCVERTARDRAMRKARKEMPATGRVPELDPDLRICTA